MKITEILCHENEAHSGCHDGCLMCKVEQLEAEVAIFKTAIEEIASYSRGYTDAADIIDIAMTAVKAAHLK